MAQPRQTPPQQDPAHPGAQAARLRADVDAGRTGDKVPASDPATSPLGTDDEAAGQINPHPIPADASATPDVPPGRSAFHELSATKGSMVMLAAIGLVVLLFLIGLGLVVTHG